MKTDFLKELGLTQEQIDKIMAENGKDVNKAKGDTEALNTKITDLESQLTDRDNQLKGLKSQVKDNDALTAKITELEEANKNAATEHQNKMNAIQKVHAVENGIRDAKAKNVKAVMALLDMEKISYADNKLTGFNEQIDALQKAEDTNFLFVTEQQNPPTPSGTKPITPPAPTGGNPTGGNAFTSAIAKALGGNN